MRSLHIFYKHDDTSGCKQEGSFRKSYLSKFVDSDKLYTVSYNYHNGERIYVPTELLGSDLTENQVVELFLNEQL